MNCEVHRFLWTGGIFDTFGDSRLEIDKDNYKMLESATDVSLVASALKLFFRELKEPLIPREAKQLLYDSTKEKDTGKLVILLKNAVQKGGMDITSQKVHFVVYKV